MTIYAVERRNKANGNWELVAFPKKPEDNNDLCMRSVAMLAENKDTIGAQYRVMPYARLAHSGRPSKATRNARTRQKKGGE